MRLGPACLAAFAWLLLVVPAAAQTALRVCLSDNVPLYSVHHGTVARGFDLAVAAAIATRLDRVLVVQWFESELDENSNMTLAANAMLSAGLCDLVGGFPLTRDTLARPGLETARLPGYEGSGRPDPRRRILLGTLAATRPYHRAALTIVLGPTGPARPVAGLADLDGLRFGVEEGSFADAILMMFGDGRFVDRVTHLVPGRDTLLPGLEHGDYDAVLVDSRRLDAYRATHPDTRLTGSGYYYRIGFNMGFVGLTTRGALIDELNPVISDMLANGALPALAAAEGLSYILPGEPMVLETPTLSDLRN